VSHKDVEEWIDADKEIVVWRTIAEGALIDAVMNPNYESKKKNSWERIFRRKNRLGAKAADAYSTPQKSAESRPCYPVREVKQLNILLPAFLQKRKKCTDKRDIPQTFQRASKTHADLLACPDTAALKQGAEKGTVGKDVPWDIDRWSVGER